MKRRALFNTWALATFGLAAVLVPAALSEPGPPQAPPYVLVDDAGGGSQSPEPPLSPHPSGSAPTTISPAPANRRPADDKKDNGSGGGGTNLSFGTETALSLGVLAVAALFLIPGRRPPRSAGARTGR